MERLHGPINPCLFGEENFGPESIERETVADAIGYNQFVGTKKFKLEEEVNLGSPSLDDTMPFLQMLQSVDSPAFSPYPEPKSTSFQLLLRLQNQKQHEVQNVQTRNRFLKTDIRASRIIPPEPESCLTHDVFETQSPVKSDNSKDVHGYTYSNSVDSGICPGFGLPDRERRKRKRTRPPKNREEVETQRMTHIAVERNRRRQMNDHLSALRSLMPSSYAHRGDQASIIGGAIDFVKELEQLLETLQAQKRMRNNNGPLAAEGTATSSSTSTMQCVDEGDWTAASSVGVSATVIQNHVNLKVECERRGGGQAVKAVVALEELRLTVLHLNISSYQSSVHYSFSLKVEDDCKLRTADEIIGAVQEIFSFINGGSWVTLV